MPPGGRAAVEAATKRRNVAVAAAALLFGCGTLFIPLLVKKNYDDQEKSLYSKEDSLSGSQVIRGAFMNTGSKDAGRDPDWDPATNTWRGKRRS